MAQGMEKDVAARGPKGQGGQPKEGQAQRFRGEMERDRTDGGFMAPGAAEFAGDEHRDYRAWRAEQLRRMDAEYEEFRRAGKKNFRSHFEEWRKAKLMGGDSDSYAGQNDKIGATPVEFGGQNATNSGFTRVDDTED